MKTETERHMLSRFTAMGTAAAAALMVIVATAVPTHADPQLFIGTQENGGPILMYPNGQLGPFSHVNFSGLANRER
jgi:hypothetical protein